jgi:adenosylcobinamide kinase/adenosylcobinamide-phosphate guanylyltransferase
VNEPLAAVTLVLGGARSGKSRFAEHLISTLGGERTPLYIATAAAGDDEMAARIAAHRARRGATWATLEVPLDLAGAIRAHRDTPMLVDCLTLWLSNAMHEARAMENETAHLLEALRAARAPVVLVSNEVGLGLVPDTPLGRAFRDEAGRLNQRVAASAGHVVFVAAGLPLYLKGGPLS